MTITLKKYWGLVFLGLISLTSLFTLLKRGASGHYDFFSASAKLIWAGQNPYGIEYPSGLFNYSPSTALFFYGPFAALEYRLGLALLSVFSLAIFVIGAQKLLSHLNFERSTQQLFYFLISSEVIGAVLNVRIELFFAGVTLWALALLLSKKQAFWPWFFLAMISNFKFQALAVAGLLLLVDLLERDFKKLQSWRSTLYFSFSLVFWFLVPLLFLPLPLFTESYKVWLHHLGGLISEGFWTFQHIYAFIYKVTQIKIPYFWTQVLSLSLAFIFALFVGYLSWRKNVSEYATLAAAGLGSAFILMCSPASQSASYILYAPLLVANFSKASAGSQERKEFLWILVAWFFISLAYSDLVGRTAREFFFDHAVKPFGIALLTFRVLSIASITSSRAALSFHKAESD